MAAGGIKRVEIYFAVVDWNLQRPEIFMLGKSKCRRREIVEEVKSQYSDHWPPLALGFIPGRVSLSVVLLCAAQWCESTHECPL